LADLLRYSGQNPGTLRSGPGAASGEQTPQRTGQTPVHRNALVAMVGAARCGPNRGRSRLAHVNAAGDPGSVVGAAARPNGGRELALGFRSSLAAGEHADASGMGCIPSHAAPPQALLLSSHLDRAHPE